MACVSVCPTQAIKVDQSNQKIHEEMVEKYAK
jgi:NAD-dependent dihydropyrimidine dehydrogenase PreA subunit